jgi:hypothetical protein
MTKVNSLRETRVSDDLKDHVLSAIQRAQEPISANEIFSALNENQRTMAYYTIQRALAELNRDGLVLARIELPVERVVRSGEQKGSYRPARLYWATGAFVPTRTLHEAIPGIRTMSQATLIAMSAGEKRRSKIRPAKASKKQTGTENKARPAKAPKMQTGNRIDRLEARIDRLENVIAARISKLEKDIASLVDAIN